MADVARIGFPLLDLGRRSSGLWRTVAHTYAGGGAHLLCATPTFHWLEYGLEQRDARAPCRSTRCGRSTIVRAAAWTGRRRNRALNPFPEQTKCATHIWYEPVVHARSQACFVPLKLGPELPRRAMNYLTTVYQSRSRRYLCHDVSHSRVAQHCSHPRHWQGPIQNRLQRSRAARVQPRDGLLPLVRVESPE